MFTTPTVTKHKKSSWLLPLFLKKTHFPSPAGQPCKSDTTNTTEAAKVQLQGRGFEQITPTALFCRFLQPVAVSQCCGRRVASPRNTAKTAVLALHQPGEPRELPPGSISSHKDSPESHLTGECTQSGYIQSGLHRRASQHS